MVENSMQASFNDVVRSMERFHRAFEDQIKTLSPGGGETDVIELTKGAMAMKDAAGIYLAWANHYMQRLRRTDAPDGDEMMEE